jgi:hypothetical protein
MNVYVEQQLPCNLGMLRRFLDKATDLVGADMTAYVTSVDGCLRVSAVIDLEQP